MLWIAKRLLEGALPEIGRYIILGLAGAVLPWLIKLVPWLVLFGIK